MTCVHSSDDVRIFHKECASLAGAGYEVFLVAPGESREEKGVHIIGVGEKPQKRLPRMTIFSHKVYDQALELDCDIYHFHDSELLPYGIKLKKRRKAVVFDSHEDIAERILGKIYIPKIARKLVSSLYKKYEEMAIKKLDGIISVTPSVVDRFKTQNANTVLVANYPILQDCPVSNRNTKQLCFAGGISPQWNHEVILDALLRIPQVTYALCGFGSKPYLEKLKLHPAWAQVNFYGKIRHEEVLPFLSRRGIGMAIVDYGNTIEIKQGTMGNTKLFEMMMAKLPVICTDFVLWKEIIENYKCGICVPPHDSLAVQKAIEYLLDHPEEAMQMGRNGRHAIEEEFNWGKEEKKLLNLYKKLTITDHLGECFK